VLKRRICLGVDVLRSLGYEWLRVDAEFDWVCEMFFEQADYMWACQLRKDRDVVAQLEVWTCSKG
jgi:transcription initiation factor TFIID subunit 2